MKLTTNLKLKKPDLTDYVNVEDFNQNADVLDAEVKALKDGSVAIGSLTTTSKTLQGAINELKAKDDSLSSQMADTMTLGSTNRIVNKVKALELKTDTRTTALTYSNGNLTKVEEKDGAIVVKTTTLNYDSSGNLANTVEVALGTRVTTSLNYSSGQLSSVTKAVV